MVVLILGIAVIVAVLAGSGGDSDDQSPKGAETPPKSSASAGTAQIDFARDFVAGYFQKITSRDYLGAWSQLARPVKDKFGDYRVWRHRYATTQEMRLSSTSAASSQDGEVSFVVNVATTVECNGLPNQEILSGPVVIDVQDRLISGLRLDVRTAADPSNPLPSSC